MIIAGEQTQTHIASLKRIFVRGPRWPAVLFVSAYVMTAFAYSVVTGPFRAPDEFNHFFRSFAVAQGHWVAIPGEGESLGDLLPESLWDVVLLAGGDPNPTNNRIDRPGLLEAYRRPLRPERVSFREHANTAVYAPAAYLPSAAAVAIGVRAECRPLLLFYIARWANVLICATVVAVAVCYMSFARWAALLIACMPMTLSQLGSVTADAMLFAVSFGWVALLVSLAFDSTGKLPNPALWTLLGLALLLSQMRPPYPLLLLLVFILSPRRFSGRMSAVGWLAAIVAAVVVPCGLWNLQAARVSVPLLIPEVQTDPMGQLRGVTERPTEFLDRVKTDLIRRAPRYWREAVGQLGWLNLSLPGWVHVGFLILLPASCFLLPRPHYPPRWWQRGLFVVTFATGILAIALLIYVSFNSVGAERINGIQGRYYLPFLLVLSVGTSYAWISGGRLNKVLKCACAAFIVSANVSALLVISRAAGYLGG